MRSPAPSSRGNAATVTAAAAAAAAVRRSGASRTRSRPNNERVFLMAVLVLGLVICSVNVLYILHLTHQQKEYTVMNNNNHHVVSRQHHHDNNNDDDDPTAGKERILQILQEAGITDISQEQLRKLPTWDDVVSLYGDGPKIVGLETSCESFRSTVSPSERLIGVAGTFNSGTNLLAELLIANCRISTRQAKYGKRSHGIRWQVNWGKHQPAKWRLLNHVDSSVDIRNENYLPVVTIRDNYSWMQSMCRRRYAAHWFHHAAGHCPNLIPNSVDWEFLEYAKTGQYKDMQDVHHKDPWIKDNVLNTAGFMENSTVVPLYVRYKLQNITHTSLAHMWNEWYRDYYDAEFPRIMIRFEDLVFHAKEVITKVCHCGGGDMVDGGFQYIVDSAKKGGDNIHGSDRTNYLEAMIKYGSAEHHAQRTKGMTNEDKDYARQVFDSELMEAFGYRFPDDDDR